MAEQEERKDRPSGPRRTTTVPPPIPAKARAQTQQLPSIVKLAPRAATQKLPSIINRASTASASNIAVPRTPTELGVPTTLSPNARVQPRPSSEALEPMRRRPQATPAIPAADAARELAAARAIDGSTSDALRDLVTTAAGVRALTTPPPMPIGRESSRAIAAAHAVVADPYAEGESARAIAAAHNVARPRALTPIESIQSVTGQFGLAPVLTAAETVREASQPALRPATIPPITNATARAHTAPLGTSSVPGLLASIPSLASAPIRAATLPPPVHTVSPVVLPPYIPAPNLGDPAEALMTVPVEKIEFTEHVEKLPFSLDDVESKPVLIPARTPIQKLARYAPWIGAAALLAIFVGGYFVFDGESTQGTMTHVSAPAPSHPTEAAANAAVATEAKPVVVAEPVADRATETVAPSVEIKPETPTAPIAAAPTPEPIVATPVKAEPKAIKADPASPSAVEAKPAAKKIAAVVTAPAPKGPRGTLAVTSNKKAQVYLDGKSASSTTPFKLQLAVGTHKLTLWDTASGKTETFQITVTAGKTTAIDKRF